MKEKNTPNTWSIRRIGCILEVFERIALIKKGMKDDKTIF